MVLFFFAAVAAGICNTLRLLFFRVQRVGLSIWLSEAYEGHPKLRISKNWYIICSNLSQTKQRCLLLPLKEHQFQPRFDATPHLAGITPTLMFRENRQWAVNPPSLAISVAARFFILIHPSLVEGRRPLTGMLMLWMAWMVWMRIWCMMWWDNNPNYTLCHCLRFSPDVWKFGILCHFDELAYSVYAVALCAPLWIEFLLGGVFIAVRWLRR